MQSQRRKQFPKNPVDIPRGRRGRPVPLPQGRKTHRPAAAPDAHTHTHSHTHARRNTHVPASCRYTRNTSATLQSCTRVFVLQPLAASSWVAQQFGERRGARHTPPSLAVSFIRTREASLGHCAPPSKSKENNTSEQQKKHQQCYARHCARDSACAQSVLACPMQAYSSVARTSRRGSTSWCTNRVRRLPRRRHER